MLPVVSNNEPSPPVEATSDAAVRDRYGAAAQQQEPALCCPVTYDPKFLKQLPSEIIEKDYGCGDPSAFVREGDTVVDLGSGGGKLCYITSQMVGSQGKVIGVDCNQEMLALARKYQQPMAEKFGYSNVEFRYGRIQDLGLDLDLFHQQIDTLDPNSPSRALDTLELVRSIRHESPMIADDSVDCVLSNCVLNLVNREDRLQLFQEIHRVLKQGGRAAISDIVCDEDVPEAMQRDGHLWSGCISGAWREDRFIDEFVQAGFYGVEVAKYEEKPWQVVYGIEFRSVTIMAYKGKEGPCLDRHQAVIYKGPFSQVEDEDGHVYQRGQRVTVCDRTFKMLTREPYQEMFIPVEPLTDIPLSDAIEIDCRENQLRSPRVTKGSDYQETRGVEEACCEPGSGCC